jgi:hypothetical protein
MATRIVLRAPVPGARRTPDLGASLSPRWRMTIDDASLSSYGPVRVVTGVARWNQPPGSDPERLAERLGIGGLGPAGLHTGRCSWRKRFRPCSSATCILFATWVTSSTGKTAKQTSVTQSSAQGGCLARSISSSQQVTSQRTPRRSHISVRSIAFMVWLPQCDGFPATTTIPKQCGRSAAKRCLLPSRFEIGRSSRSTRADPMLLKAK